MRTTKMIFSYAQNLRTSTLPHHADDQRKDDHRGVSRCVPSLFFYLCSSVMCFFTPNAPTNASKRARLQISLFVERFEFGLHQTRTRVSRARGFEN